MSENYRGAWLLGGQIVLFLLLATPGFSFGSDEKEDQQVMKKQLEFQENERLVFFGDSITHEGSYWRHLLLFQALRHPKSRVVMLNGGISGDNAEGGCRRLESDILKKEPDRVFILFGMNDVGRGLYSSRNSETIRRRREKQLEKYRRNMTALVDQLSVAGKKTVLITPTPFDEYAELETVNLPEVNQTGLAGCALVVRELATERKLAVIDFHSRLTAVVRKGDGLFARSDRVHPSLAGHYVMAAVFLQEMGETSPAVESVIDVVTGKVKTCRTEIEILQATRKSLCFRYTPEVLPFPIDDSMRTAEKMYSVFTVFNRETLQITGLRHGNYQLKSNGRLIGRFSHIQLATAVDLSILDTPARRAAVTAGAIADRIVRINRILRHLAIMRLRIDSLETCRSLDEEYRAIDYYISALKDQHAVVYYSKVAACYKKNRSHETRLARELASLYPALYEASKTVTYTIEVFPAE